MIIGILFTIHIILCVISFALCKRSGEKEWWLLAVLWLIPYIGPLFVVFLYVNYKIRENAKRFDDSYNELNQ